MLLEQNYVETSWTGWKPVLRSEGALASSRRAARPMRRAISGSE